MKHPSLRSLCPRRLAGQRLSPSQARRPGRALRPDVPVTSKDRVYLSDQFSNTVSVVDPATARLLGVIKLGEQTPQNLSPLYKEQLLVHGMGFSPDHRTLAVVSIGSNSVAFIDTATNAVKHISYVGRSPARSDVHAGRQGGLGHGPR